MGSGQVQLSVIAPALLIVFGGLLIVPGALAVDLYHTGSYPDDNDNAAATKKNVAWGFIALAIVALVVGIYLLVANERAAKKAAQDALVRASTR